MTLLPLERFDDPPEIRYARRAFGTAQRLLAGTELTRVGVSVDVGWYDVAVHPERGYFATVDSNGPYTDLVGDILLVNYPAERRSLYVFCVAAATLPVPLCLARTAFLRLAALSRESILCEVRTVERA